MTRDIDIANMALAHIACTPIQSWQEGSDSSRLIQLHYENCRRDVLRQFPWTFAKVTEPLAKTDFKLPKWNYVYKYPVHCVRVIRLFPRELAGRDEIWTEYEASLAPDGKTRIIGVNSDDVFIEYIYDVTDTTTYDPLFIEALSYKLAFEINRAKTNDGDMTNELYQRYREAIENAKHASVMETKHKVQWPDSYLTFRRGARGWRSRRRT